MATAVQARSALVQSRNRQRDTAAKTLAPCKNAIGIHAIKIARDLRQRAAPTDALDKSGRSNPPLQVVRTSNIVIQREHGIPHGGKSRHVMPAAHRPIDVVKHQAQRHALRHSGTTDRLDQTSVNRIVTELKGDLRVTGAGVNKVNRRNGQDLESQDSKRMSLNRKHLLGHHRASPDILRALTKPSQAISRKLGDDQLIDIALALRHEPPLPYRKTE